VDEVSDLLSRWGDGSAITLDELGGPTALLDRHDLAQTHLLRAVQAICDSWAALENRRSDAVKALLEAAGTEDVALVSDIHEELLTNPDVITVIHKDLEKVVRRRAAGATGILADIAAETWTRLALGGWCTSSLPVCGHLTEMADTARAIGATSSYLVRAVGAALQQWGYDDVRDAMSNLRTIDEYESDAAFELGLHQLGLACVSTDRDVVLERLRAAVALFEDAASWEGRVDVRAYLGPLQGLLRFIGGGVVTEEEVAAARAVVSEYLLGYRGLARHWRQGRADLTNGWATLLSLLQAASDGTQPDWFDPSNIIKGAAGLLIADTTLTLVSRTPDSGNQGVVALVEPMIAEAFSNHGPSAVFIDRWMTAARAATEPDLEMIGAVAALKELTLQGESHPKAGGGPGGLSPGTAEANIEAFRAFYQARERTIGLVEEAVACRIFDDIKSIVPDTFADAAAEIAGLVTDLVRFTAFYLSQRQSGSRSAEWLVGGRDVEGHFPGEHRLSDALKLWFAPSFNVGVEDADVAGGFADVVLRYSRFNFYVEVKREEDHRDNLWLVDKYGDQATQYAVSDIPVVFLAVLDYASRVTRIDLPGTFWTVTHGHPGATRDYALTGFRVQANTSSPSAISAASVKTKRDLRANAGVAK
jgi:hypothetical protein